MPRKGSRTGITQKCIKCGAPFYVHPAHVKREIKYCSRVCYLEAFTKLVKSCSACGKNFTVKEKERRKKFCSLGCYHKTINGRVLSQATRKKLSERKMGAKHPFWKGGIQESRGRVYLLRREHGSASANYHYIPRARLVVEARIGRELTPLEIVHHRNRKKSDDRIKNLMVFSSNSAHHRFHGDPKNVRREEIIFDGRMKRLSHRK